MTMDYNDRGEHPKHPGERGAGHGNSITLTLPGDHGPVERGEWVQVPGDGTISQEAEDDGGGALPEAAVVKHSAEPGDEVTTHLSGLIRVRDDSEDADTLVVDEVGDDLLVRLR